MYTRNIVLCILMSPLLYSLTNETHTLNIERMTFSRFHSVRFPIFLSVFIAMYTKFCFPYASILWIDNDLHIREHIKQMNVLTMKEAFIEHIPSPGRDILETVYSYLFALNIKRDWIKQLFTIKISARSSSWICQYINFIRAAHVNFSYLPHKLRRHYRFGTRIASANIAQI